MRTTFVLALVALAAAVAIAAVPLRGVVPVVEDKSKPFWTNCTAATDNIHITEVLINPDPPSIGDNVTVFVAGILSSETVTSGSYVFTVDYDGAPIVNLNEQICDYFSCPVAPGPVNISHSVVIPTVTPPGLYTGQATLTDQNNNQLACLSFSLNLIPSH